MIIRQRKNFLNQKILFISVFSRHGGRQGGDDGVVFPFITVGQNHQSQRRFVNFPDTFERLERLQPQQLPVSRDLRRVVQHVAPEHADQSVAFHERRQSQKNKPALVAIGAPSVQPLAFVQLERLVAAGEHRIVFSDFRKQGRDRQLGQRTQQRKIAEIGQNGLRQRAESPFEFD